MQAAPNVPIKNFTAVCIRFLRSKNVFNFGISKRLTEK